MCRSNPRIAALFLGALLAVSYPAWTYYSVFMWDPGLFHEELRILFPYHRFVDPTLFEGDYILAFLQQSAHSPGYDAITWVWAKLCGNIRLFHVVVLPLSVTLIYMAGIFLAARLMGGLVVAWGAVALSLLQSNVLYQMASSLPHAFAFPLLAWTLYSLQRSSVTGLVVLTVLSAALYPVMTPIIGLAFAYYLLVTPPEWRVNSRIQPLHYRLGILAAAGISAILVASASLPHLEGAYGDYLPPGTHTEAFPENGIDGRHFRGALEPVSYSVLAFAQQFTFLASEDFLKPGTRRSLAAALATFLLILGVALLAAPARCGPTARLKPFLFASVITAVVFVPLVPSLGYRFIFYPLHILFALLFPLAVAGVFQRLAGSADHVRFVGMVLVIAVLSIFMNARYPGPMMPHALMLTADQQSVVAFAEQQPVNAMFAGWPGGVIDVVPYLAKRSALLLYKTHYPIYEAYAREMRQRMYAMMDAYFGVDSTPLKRLRDRWAVRFFIVDRYQLDAARRGDGDPLRTFRPFDQYRDEVLGRNAGGRFYLANPPKEAVVHEAGKYYVLDLSLL